MQAKRRKGTKGKSDDGQTMLEAIIAIGILITAITSSLTLVQGAINAEAESAKGVVAANLAREGVEVVRQIRDSNWLAGNAWDAGLEGAGSDYTGVPVFAPSTGIWTMDFSPNDVSDDAASVYTYTAAAGSAAEGLQVQGASQPAGTAATGFHRLVTLNAICGDGSELTTGASCGPLGKVGMRVTSEVTWTRSGGALRSVSVEEELYDWR